MTLYYTVNPDITNRENHITVYEIYNNYPHYTDTIFIPFDNDIKTTICECLVEAGYENFEISRL